MNYRIGVDARLLSEQLTGIGRYTLEMLTRLTGSGHEWYLYAPTPIVLGDWRQPNVHLRAARFPSRPMRMLWAQTALPWWAARDRVDLFWAPTHRLPRLLRNDIARVVTIHDLVWKFAGDTMRPTSRWLDAKLMPEAVQLADQVIAVSRNTAQDLIAEIPGSADKTDAIALGVTAPDRSEPEDLPAEFGLTEPFFLFVGTLEPRKNLQRLLEAYASLPVPLRNTATLAIVGGKGWGGVDVATIAERFNIRDRVRLLGYVNDEQLAGLYRKALFLAMPSLYEGFGLPLLEAMIRGTPVLTSQRASMPEVAGDAGLLVDPDRVDSIASALTRLLGDPGLRRRLAEKTVPQARPFTWERAAAETLTVFDKALAKRRSLLGSNRAGSTGRARPET